ncbi:MAG TPA: HAD hydrolase-like protein [Thermoleophilia bacterium]|nr:HAD hydrolase-like protein [Thermoleophilia bacterium]
MRRLALFDIDCTLIDAHGAGGRAIVAAIAETFGVSGSLEDYTFHGRTDPGIVTDLAIRWGALGDEVRSRLAACLAAYVRLLEGEVVDGVIEVLAGVRELVSALAVDERVLLGVLTGNVEAGAAVKLAPTGLADLFAVGAYGSDSPDRSELPSFAIERAEALVGHRHRGKEIVIVGDTPADILCGADHRAKAIAVATGRHSVAELAAHGPDFVFADLGDWRAVYEAIIA